MPQNLLAQTFYAPFNQKSAAFPIGHGCDFGDIDDDAKAEE